MLRGRVAGLFGVATLLICVLCASGCDTDTKPSAENKGDPERGKQLAQDFGCGSCHMIPGIPSAQGQVGPPLQHMAHRGYLGGILPNSYENLVSWIQNPQSVAPESAMPNLGLTREQAEDIAAYLYTLK